MSRVDLVVVDDEFSVVYTIRAILEPVYRDVTTFTHPTEAARFISAEGCRVLVTDLRMPDMDGLELLHLALEHDPDIQVIMLTAHGSEKVAVEAMRKGAYHYLTKPFDPEELKLVVQKALEQYDLRKKIQYDLEMARTLQSNLLPAHPIHHQGLEIDGRYLPGGDVGGDYFDALVLPDQALGLIIADATGHGISAAMMMAMLKMAFLNTAPTCRTPAEFLNTINEQFYTMLKSQSSFTVFYAIFRTDPWRMVFANAGHPFPLLFREHEGRFITSDTAGLGIGFFPNVTYEDAEILLKPEDRILFYTDGLSDLGQEDDFFEFFRNRYRELTYESGSIMLEELFKLVVDFQGAREDDITLLLVRH
jgi:sigma-B regulation protein RsbU (phosphoserine phosphatase)